MGLAFAAARIGDPITHDMVAPSGVIGPPIVPPPPTAGTVMIEGMPAAYVTCTVLCTGATSAGMPAHPPPPPGSPPPPIVVGAPSVRINGQLAARWVFSGDSGACAVQLGDMKLATLRTVRIGGPMMPGAAKAVRYNERKQQIAMAKWQIGQMPYGDDREKLEKATERLERNNKAMEMARLASDVYGPDPNKPPEGWKNISGDPEALRKIGLTPDNLHVDGSNYRAQVYAPDPNVFGKDMKTTVSFQGTTNLGEDMDNNIAQGLDRESLYYKQAVTTGRNIERADADVEITGHSLGGGMASAASRASGKPAWTYNSAGLHDNTVSHYGGTVHQPDPENISAFRVENEVLTGLQEQGLKGTVVAARAGWAVGGPIGAVLGAAAKIGLSAAMPDAIGTKYDVPGKWEPGTRHMMWQMNAGIEKLKEEDLAILKESLEEYNAL